MRRVLASFATSIDGNISDFKGRWKPMCGYELERYLKTVDESDAVIVASNTVNHSGLSFEPRIEKEFFIKVLVDQRLEVPATHPFFKERRRKTKIIVYFSNAYKKKLKAERIYGNDVELVGFNGKYISARTILNKLEEYGASNIALLGGGSLLASFLKENALDIMRITVTPLILGRGIPLINRVLSAFPGKKLRLVRTELCACGQEVVLYYHL